MTDEAGQSISPLPSGAERDRTIQLLSTAFADDVLTMDEFEQRAELVYRASTSADLQHLVADLKPMVGNSESGGSTSVSAFPEMALIRTVFGNIERGGSAKVPRQLRLRTLFGNTELDYSRAEFAAGVTEIDVRCTFGNIEITVPRGVHVEMACGAVLASVTSHARDDRSADGARTVVRLIGRAVFGNVEVHVAGEAH
jgi:hypothetical protein